MAERLKVVALLVSIGVAAVTVADSSRGRAAVAWLVHPANWPWLLVIASLCLDLAALAGIPVAYLGVINRRLDRVVLGGALLLVGGIAALLLRRLAEVSSDPPRHGYGLPLPDLDRLRATTGYPRFELAAAMGSTIVGLVVMALAAVVLVGFLVAIQRDRP